MPKRKIIQHAKNSIAKLLIKRLRLKAHRIQVHGPAAFLERFFFRPLQQPLTITLPAQPFIHPQNVDVQPAPIDISQQPASDGSILAANKQVDRLEAVIINELVIKTAQSLAHKSGIRFRGFKFVGYSK